MSSAYFTLKKINFSIIIPVMHEEKIINGCINHLKNLDSNYIYEIIVVDGDPSQSTINTISDQSVLRFQSEANRGKQMNTGAEKARGEILVFLHADTQLPENAFKSIQKLLQQQEYIGGAFSLRFDLDKKIMRIIAKFSTLRSHITRLPYGDQVIFLRKHAFEQIGGYTTIPLMEDIELMRRIRKAKQKIKILPQEVTTSSRRFEQEGLLYSMIRNFIIITLYHCGVSAVKLKQVYRDISG